MAFRKFADHHDQMVDLSAAIIDLAIVNSADALVELQQKRIDLSRKVSEHCASEIEALNKSGFDRQPTPQKTALVRRYHSELLAWRGALMQCNANWPTKRISQEPQGFLRVFKDITAQLRERVRWEEQEFYPAIFGTAVLR